MDKKTKKFNLIPLYSNNISWDLSKKKECDNIINKWHKNFKLSNLKKRSFLKLLNNDCLDIKPSDTKEGL